MRTYVRMTRRMPPPRGPRVAPLQLELGAADRLAALIEESGEPLAPERAAGALLALPHVPGELARRVLEEVVQRRCAARPPRRRPRRSRRPGATRRARRSREAVWTVVDLETTGVGASARIVEIGAVRARARRAGRHDLTPRRPGHPHAARASRRSRASATATSPARARCGPHWPNCSRLRVAACSSPTTRPSTSACSIAPSRASTARASGCACSTRSGSHGGCWPAGWRASTSPASPSASTSRSGRAIARCPTRSPRPRCCWG